QGRVAERDLRVQQQREADIVRRVKADHRSNTAVSDALNADGQGRTAEARRVRDIIKGKRNAQLVEPVPSNQPSGAAAGSGEAHAAAGQGLSLPAAQPEAGPRFRLSVDGVRLWNTALGLGTLGGERAGWAADADAGAGPVEIEDALQNLADNAELLGACRAREAGWIQWATDHGFMTP